MHIVHSDQAPKAVGPYSQAIVSGNHVFCSGQVHFNVAENKLISGSVAEQTHQCLTNLKAVLAAANPSKPLTLKNVIKTTVFLTDMKDFAEMNAAYAEAFDGHAPARSTIQVAGLPLGSRVEIEAIAAIDV
ncbi:putative endoribonuclease L-PSP [Ramicandelaber brevisporus]|nr:putative endoribonuclease L-PSP [Ramicandelaber brevisporus]